LYWPGPGVMRDCLFINQEDVAPNAFEDQGHFFLLSVSSI